MYLGCRFYLCVYVEFSRIPLEKSGLHTFPCTINCQTRAQHVHVLRYTPVLRNDSVPPSHHPAQKPVVREQASYRSSCLPFWTTAYHGRMMEDQNPAWQMNHALLVGLLKEGAMPLLGTLLASGGLWRSSKNTLTGRLPSPKRMVPHG